MPISTKPTTHARSIELFTGAGGLALATHMSGFKHASLYEWNEDACDTLRANADRAVITGLTSWKNKVIQGDVCSADFAAVGTVDLVAGGPPCQPFSLAGKHVGMEDPRDMIPQFIRAVRETKPRAFIMENVRGLTRKAFASYLNFSILQLTYPDLTRHQGEAWEKHLARLNQHHTSGPQKSGLSYNVVYSVLNAANYGVPQCRERIFIVGFRNDINAHWSFPEATHSQDALLFDQYVSRTYWERLGMEPTRVFKTLPERLARLRHQPLFELKPWRTVREAIASLPQPFENKDDHRGVLNHRFQAGARPYVGHTGSFIDGPSKTLKAGGHGVPGGENMIAFENGTYRYFTVREAARMQTFPDNWHFKGAWSEAMRQLGNAVPVDLAKVVAKSVATTLKRSGAN